METNVSKASYSLRGVNKIEAGENIQFAIENKMSGEKKKEIKPERVLKVEGKVFVSQHINGARKSNCNVKSKSDNVLSANDEDLMNILANLGETEINISCINENNNNMNNPEPGGPSTTTSTTTDKSSINTAALMD